MTYIKVHHQRLQQMKDALKESGWDDLGGIGQLNHADYRDEHIQAVKAKAADTLDRVDELIDVLGLRDEYPDETTQIYRPWDPYGNGAYYETQTTYGRTRFLADIHAAHQATASNDALKRIRSVLGKGAR